MRKASSFDFATNDLFVNITQPLASHYHLIGYDHSSGLDYGINLNPQSHKIINATLSATPMGL